MISSLSGGKETEACIKQRTLVMSPWLTGPLSLFFLSLYATTKKSIYICIHTYTHKQVVFLSCISWLPFITMKTGHCLTLNHTIKWQVVAVAGFSFCLSFHKAATKWKQKLNGDKMTQTINSQPTALQKVYRVAIWSVLHMKDYLQSYPSLL